MEAERDEILHGGPEDTSNMYPEGQSSIAYIWSPPPGVQSVSRTSEQPTRETASSNSAVDPKPKLETLNDHLKFFGVFPLYQQLGELDEEVIQGTITVEEYKEELKRFNMEVLETLYHTYDPYTVSRRGGSAKELTHARELRETMNETLEVMNLLNRKTVEKLVKVSALFPDVASPDVVEVNEAIQFAHLRNMNMEMHLLGASGEERKITEEYRDFYSCMKQVMGAVLKETRGADRLVAGLYYIFLNLIDESHISEKNLVWFLSHIRLLPDKRKEQEERDKLVRMFMMVHRVTLKQENARLKKGLENLFQKIEGEGRSSRENRRESKEENSMSEKKTRGRKCLKLETLEETQS